MDDFLQSIYLGEIAQECDFCFSTVAKMNEQLENDMKNQSDFFKDASDLVNHAAAISRMLWPPNDKNKQKRVRATRRGKALRKILDVQYNHPIQNRKLRNHFEHFDERLDDWAHNSRNKNIVRNLIGSPNAIGGDAIDATDIINSYDPSTRIYSFRGESFNIQELVNAITDINQRVHSVLKQIDPHYEFVYPKQK